MCGMHIQVEISITHAFFIHHCNFSIVTLAFCRNLHFLPSRVIYI